MHRLYNCSQVGYATDLPRLELPHEYLVLMDYEIASKHAVCSDALPLISQEERMS